MKSQREELDSLLMDWESGALDESGIQRLREILRSDATARSHFVDMQMIAAALQQDAAAAVGWPFDGDRSATRQSENAADATIRTAGQGGGLHSPRRWIVLASLLLLILFGPWLASNFIPRGVERPLVPLETADGEDRDSRDESAGQNEPTAQGVASLTRLVGVTWEGDRPGVEVGQALPPGRFAIEAGHAQIEFFCGATVIVEGPAELELVSAAHARVHQGRLRAHVPPAARGFSLDVEDLKVVDLGTEFGLSVSSDGTSVEVFDGEVELQPAARERRLLKSGQAVVRTASGRYRDTEAAPEKFVDFAGLEARAQVQESARYERWKEWSAGLRRDPRVIACYAFDEPGDWKRRLACSNEPPDPELDGAIVGAREVAGRWPTKRALEFKQPADRVRVQIPGEYGSLTLACWARIDSLDRWYNSLFLTDGYDKGEPHWQIMEDGRIYFSVRPVNRGEPGPRDYKAYSPPFWELSLQGKWIHLAVTCDLETNTIVHYLNGQVLSRHTVPAAQMPAATRIGTASIGNWALPTLPDARFAVRNLNGSIGEFAIFSEALTAEEIREMYEYGKP